MGRADLLTRACAQAGEGTGVRTYVGVRGGLPGHLGALRSASLWGSCWAGGSGGAVGVAGGERRAHRRGRADRGGYLPVDAVEEELSDQVPLAFAIHPRLVARRSWRLVPHGRGARAVLPGLL